MFYAAVFLLAIILLFFVWSVKKPDNFPPGPQWYPFVGSALQVSQMRLKYGMFCKVIEQLHKTYLNPYGLFGLKIGSDNLVVAYSGDAIREFMTNEDLDGRPTGIFYTARTFGLRKGIMLTDREFWQEQRRFILKHLKDFGFARRGMIDIIKNEAQYMQEDMKAVVLKQGGKSAIISMLDFFPVFVLNTLWTMIAGKRYNRYSCEVVELLDMFFELFKAVDMIGCVFGHFPFLRYVAPDLSGYNSFVNIHGSFYNFVRKEIVSHKETFQVNSPPRDLIDSYLQILATTDHGFTTFSEEQLLAVCLDMFSAGSETTNKSIGFGFLHLVRNPQIQKKAQEELDAVVGRDRLPTWEDKPNLPYCEGIILEAVRFFVGHTFGIPHRALVDTRLSGYDIPKDTMVVACFRGMAMNPEFFPKPNEFNPERYLVNGKCVAPEYFIPFGVGKHRCMGEIMGRQNLFMFTTTLLQSFTFLPIDPNDLPDDEPIDGATASVKPFSAKVVPRDV